MVAPSRIFGMNQAPAPILNRWASSPAPSRPPRPPQLCYTYKSASGALRGTYQAPWFSEAHPQQEFGEWLSLVEHLVRDQGVGGSNPLSPTIFRINKLQNFSPVTNILLKGCFSCKIFRISLDHNPHIKTGRIWNPPPAPSTIRSRSLTLSQCESHPVSSPHTSNSQSHCKHPMYSRRVYAGPRMQKPTGS
jgi:hypothetical protein